MYAYVKNKFVKQSQALISIAERGFRFGDGFFNTILIDNFQPYQWQYHRKKLKVGLSYLKLNVNIEYIEAIAKKLIVKNQLRSGLLRISISRGIGGQGYQPLLKIRPTIVIETIRMKSKNSNDNSNLWIATHLKISSSSINPNIKLMAATQNILSRIEALEQDCCEALLLDENGIICEGSSSNIFWIKNRQIYTPAFTNPIYQGSIRNAILNLFPDVKEVSTSIAALDDADEIFLTNVGWKIKSINSIKNLSNKNFTTKITKEIIKKLQYDIQEKTRHLHAWQL